MCLSRPVSPPLAHWCVLICISLSVLNSREDCGDRDDIVSFGKSSANRCIVPMATQDSTITSGSVIQTPYPSLAWVSLPSYNSTVAAEGWSQSKNLSSDGSCDDRGTSSRVIRSCPFGQDSVDCGHRELTLPKSKTSDREPDNTCITASNGLCEDQLYFSSVAPNDVLLHSYGLCLPNTE